MATATVQTGERVYYTGDRANGSGWGSVVSADERNVELVLDDGRSLNVFPGGIGDVYSGNCDPRFLIEEAVLDYRSERISRGDAAIAAEVKRGERGACARVRNSR